MTNEQNIRYREILIDPIRECAGYTPKFGHSRKGGYSLADFQALYTSDAFYGWLGLDNPLMYSAHKAAGGITSVYRQIGIGCERLVRTIFMDYLGLSTEDVIWSYTVKNATGKKRTLSLDGRIVFEKILNTDSKMLCESWMKQISNDLELPCQTQQVIKGIVFEVRQGYKSKDSKRQNADIANAANAYANGYIPCLMVMSTQIDDDIVTRYKAAKWAILRGYIGAMPTISTFSFFDQVIGFNFVEFMNQNQEFFQFEIQKVLEQLMRAN